MDLVNEVAGYSNKHYSEAYQDEESLIQKYRAQWQQDATKQLPTSS